MLTPLLAILAAVRWAITTGEDFLAPYLPLYLGVGFKWVCLGHTGSRGTKLS